MIFDPTDLNRTIAIYHPHPFNDGDIVWGKIHIATTPGVGLLLEAESGLFYMCRPDSCQLLDQAAVRRALHTAICE